MQEVEKNEDFKHSPSPFVFGVIGKGVFTFPAIADANNKTLAVMESKNFGDLAVMTAAPELLSACELVLTLLMADEYPEELEIIRCVDILENVIKKAKGDEGE